MGIETFGRDEFLADYWTYAAGQHVTFLGPTGCGKTHLKWQLLQCTATRDVPATVLAFKPRDRTTTEWAKKLGYFKIGEYPPPISPRRLLSKPIGRVLWPKHSYDPDIDDPIHARIFRAALLDAYKRGNQIIDVDEILDAVDLELETSMRTLWTRGRSQGAGLWAGSQQPFEIPKHAYRQAEHLFIAKDSDSVSRQRYGQIGGMDADSVRAWVMGLKKHQFLYIRRTGPAVCIVDK